MKNDLENFSFQTEAQYEVNENVFCSSDSHSSIYRAITVERRNRSRGLSVYFNELVWMPIQASMSLRNVLQAMKTIIVDTPTILIIHDRLLATNQRQMI